MKKLLIPVVLIFLMSAVFLSCSGHKDFTFEPEKSFTVHMKAFVNGKEICAYLSLTDYEKIKIDFTYPDTVDGFSVSLENGRYILDIKGIKDELGKDEIKDSSFLNMLTDTIRTSVYLNHGKFTEKDGFYTAELMINGIWTEVKFTPDGYISSIDAKDASFSAEFSC